MLTRLTFAFTALALLVAPARADCARAQLATMCEWTAVEEWLAQQRAEAEARARMWQLFGPQPSTARIEEVRQWSLGSLARRVLRGPSPAMKLSATSDVICCRGPDPNGVPPIPRHHTARIERASS
jgi:hypothetical protein